MCPYCKNDQSTIRRGAYKRLRGRRKRIQRFYCHRCHRTWSRQTLHLSHHQWKPDLNRPLYRLLCSGVSQRRCARLLGISPTTVARRVVRFGDYARRRLASDRRRSGRSVHVAVFDEMESFEHSRCKPLSMAVAVEQGSRRILGVAVSQMPAKGHLARISRKKYGPRADHRGGGIRYILRCVRTVASRPLLLKSDKCPRYPGQVLKILPRAVHETFKGRRACTVGMGEMKVGGFDPLFSLNHTCAMFRDNLKTLSRRTWCTTKRQGRLEDLMNVYATYHNQVIAGVRNPGVAYIRTRV